MALNLGSFGEAFVNIRANLATLDRDLKKVSGRVASGLATSGRRIGRAGKQLSLGLLIPIAGLGGIAVRQFGRFDAAMTESLAIMGDVSNAMRRDMAGAAREMAKTTSFSAKEAAESFFFLASAGLDAAASIKTLPVVARFAQAGNFDMALATDLLTDAQSALGKTIRNDAIKNMKEMIRVSDTLVKANTLANATVQQFSESLTNRAGAAMRQLNIDIEEGVAVLATWADQGLKGQIAGEQFNIVTRDLQRAARDNTEQFKKMNVQVFDSAGGLRNLADIVADLENLLGPLSIKQQGLTLSVLGFQERSVQAIRSLLGFSGAIRDYEAALRDAGGITKEVADKQLEGFNKKLGLTLARLNDVAISVGELLSPVVLQFARFVESKVVPAVEKAVATFRNMDQRTAAIAGKVALLAIAFGPALIVVGLLGQALGFIVGGLGLFGSAIFKTIRVLVLFSGIVIKVMAVAATAVLRFLLMFPLLLGPIVLALGAILGSVAVFKRTIVAFFKGIVIAVKNAFVVGFNNSVVRPFQIALKALSRLLPASSRELIGLDTITVQDVVEPTLPEDMKKVWAEAGENAAREMEKFKETASKGIDFVKDKFKGLAGKVLDLVPTLDFGTAVEGVEDELQEIVVTAKRKFAQIKPIIDGVKVNMEELGETIASSMERNLLDATTAFQSFGDAAKNIIQQVLASLVQLILIRPFVKGILAAVGIPVLGHGGRVGAGEAVITGDRGAELFVPDVSGQIIPNNRIRIGAAGEGGGVGDIHQEFNFPLVFPTQLEAFVRNVAGPAGRDAATQVLRARQGRF